MEVSLTFVSCVWNGLLFITLLTKLYKHKGEDSFGSKTIVIATLTNNLGWCICFLIKGIIKTDEYQLVIIGLSLTSTTILQCIYAVVYSIAFISSYIFVIEILYQSFKGSEFQISKCTLYSHIIITIILFSHVYLLHSSSMS